jgi:hypothetical protein
MSDSEVEAGAPAVGWFADHLHWFVRSLLHFVFFKAFPFSSWLEVAAKSSSREVCRSVSPL